mmetsp:Transcript_33341/g.87765  ORF Transcript_33341/g.87765 Transcript_33341/m.87765 type:complete len:315 (+) Transcript_33341:72-1016(+)
MKLYSRPLSVEYHANTITCATFLTALYGVALIVIPYVATYSLGGMWAKEVFVREQPSTKFRYEALVEAYGTSASHEVAAWTWSTSTALNMQLGTALRPMQLSYWEEDDELDGKADRLQFVLRVPLDSANSERLLSMRVLLGVDVSFKDEFDLRLNSSLVMEASSGLSGRTWNQTADLVLRSEEPQRSKALGQREPCPSPVWAMQHPITSSGAVASIPLILSEYATCNDTATLTAQPALWNAGIGSNFEASLTVRVPSMLLTRKPGVVETLKLAFVQYVALFIPIALLLTCLHGALFTTGVLAARVHHPIKLHRF